MKKNYLFLLVGLLISNSAISQVTKIYTDYQGFWESSSTNINPTKPNNSHLLLAFTYNGTTYSTGVDDAALGVNGLTNFTPNNYRGLPLTALPHDVSGSSYFVGLGQLYDGLDDATDNSPNSPFKAITSDAELAYFLTDGEKGLDLGTGIANTPGGEEVRFELSSHKITLADINDNIPDIIVSNIAQPTGSNNDKLKFINTNGDTVGMEIIVNMNNNPTSPIVANWLVDFYEFNSVSGGSNYTKTQRNLRFLPLELSQFDIDSNNYQDAVALIYTTGGTSDPAFIAYKEEAIAVASKLNINSQPTTSYCDGTMDSNFVIEVQDFNGAFIPQAGFPIKASIYSGPGQLLGTTSKLTDATGRVTFDNLSFEIGGDHSIVFESSSLEPVVTSNIIQDTGCTNTAWTGSINSDWNNPGNWTAGVPNANVNVLISESALGSVIPNYPILNIDAGVKNLTLDEGASINLNGFLFAIEGLTTQLNSSSLSFIDGSTPGSNLYFSGDIAQSIETGLINGNLAQLTVENPSGFDLNADLIITEVLRIKAGAFNTHDRLTLACDFAQLGAAQVDRVQGSVVGEMTIEQCFPARRAFRLVSSPINTTTSIHANWQEGATGYLDNPKLKYGTHITGLGENPQTTEDGNLGFDYNPSGNPSLFEYDNSTSAWSPIDNTDTNTLTAGVPYRLFVRGDRSIDVLDNSAIPEDTKLRAEGTITTGTQTLTGFNSTAGKFNFFGNPYPAAVNMAKVFNNSNTLNTTRVYYIYDPNLGGNPTVGQPGGRGAFVAIDVDDLTTSVPSGASGTSEGNQFLQPMQAAFFVTKTTGITPQLRFRESYKNVEVAATDVFRSNATPFKSIAINLFTEDAYLNEETASDGVKIKFGENYNSLINSNDAPKLGNPDENIARVENQDYVTLEQRNLPIQDEILPLFINQYRYENYVMSIHLNESFDYKVYLDDAYLQTSTLLEQGDQMISYQVDSSIPESISSSRFQLRFGEQNLNTGLEEVGSLKVYPNPIKNGSLHIELPNAFRNQLNLRLVNLMGQQVLEQNINAQNKGKISLNNLSISTGVYYLKITNTTTGISNVTKIINP